MAQVREIMSRDVVCIAPDASIRHAAELMQRYDVGSLPVCDGERIVGMVTGRDLGVRALTGGCSPQDPVARIATSGGQCCYDDKDVEIVQRRMGEAQIRRVPMRRNSWARSRSATSRPAAKAPSAHASPIRSKTFRSGVSTIPPTRPDGAMRCKTKECQ